MKLFIQTQQKIFYPKFHKPQQLSTRSIFGKGFDLYPYAMLKQLDSVCQVLSISSTLGRIYHNLISQTVMFWVSVLINSDSYDKISYTKGLKQQILIATVLRGQKSKIRVGWVLVRTLFLPSRWLFVLYSHLARVERGGGRERDREIGRAISLFFIYRGLHPTVQQKCQLLSHVQFFAIPQTVAHQASLSL